MGPKARRFRERVAQFIQLFGLLDYDVHVEAHHPKGESPFHACCSYSRLTGDEDGRTATIYYDARGIEGQTLLFVDGLAFHEVAELLLCRLRDMALMKKASTDFTVDSEAHRVVNILQNVFLKDAVKKAGPVGKASKEDV